MIEIDETPNYPDETHDLIIDGVLTDHEYARVHRGHKGKFTISLYNQQTIDQVVRYSILDLPPIEFLYLPFRCEGTPVTALSFRCRDVDTPRPHRYTITFEAEPDLANWTKPYSFAEYCDELSRHIQELNTVVGADTCFQTAQDDNKRLRVSTFWVEFPVSAPALPLTKEIDSRVQTLRMLHERIENTLLAIASSNSVAVSFSFPEQVKVACEQYLIYFVEFLRDLGVEATSDLRDEAGRVLFTVTPKDPLEALDNIRVALEIYLRLPASPISDGEAGVNDVSTQKLLANIHHLTGQLALARALLETKNATIQAQQVAISQNVVSATVVVDSVVEITPVPQKDDKEEFLGGTLAITKYQGKGFEINVPELIRMLKRRFGKSS